MKISGTFLKSKVAQRIALLLLLAATIPASLMTGLSRHAAFQLVSDYEHKSLVDKSQSYALASFSNLSLVSEKLKQFSELINSDTLQNSELESLSQPMFRSLAQMKLDGKILNKYGEMERLSASSEAIVRNAIVNIHGDRAELIILPSDNAKDKPTIYLALPHQKTKYLKTLLVAEINPDFLFGKKENYPEDINVCVYQLAAETKIRIFCSKDEPSALNAEKADVANTGAWELFLRGNFDTNSWVYETSRRYPATADKFATTIGSDSYIGIAILSLLLVGLLSLIQIRRTMVPLERLIEGTKKVSLGDFSSVKVDGSSEFSELASAFNTMSSRIKKQFDTLRSLSSIDQEIVTKLDVEQLIYQVMLRMQQLKPDASFYIFRLDEKTGSEVQCSVNIAGNPALSSARIPVSIREINAIKVYGQGHVSHCTMSNNFAHERLAAELGDHYLWAVPIFWQREICAFLAVSSKARLDEQDADWNEFRELASRIGLVISAQEREEKLLLQAQYDTLTSLPNRILLQDRLQQAMEHSDRTGNPIWVLFLDLDRFKYVNDSMGHHAGDDLLVQISKRLQAGIREADTVARFGGDEFIIILQGDMDENSRLNVLNRLIDSVATPMKVNMQELVTTCSVGISVYPNDGFSADVLIKHADIAMYRAKELGRNNFQFFTQSMNEKAAERMHLETLLRKALEQSEFYLHYQPKVDLASKQIVGVEALLRWNNAELGIVPPNNFIHMTEETGLILSIGEWVLRTACKQAVAWQKAGLGNHLMAVNLSARQFKQDNLVESIKTILVETGLKAECLELELTESLFMDNTETSLKILHEIKALGIKLSVDDFGTGYSSLSYLNSLPLDAIKIDKVFIDDIVLNNDKVPIVDAIISLGKNLNLKVVAEGVESSAQVTYLAARGCDQIQGYYFSRPEPANKIEVLLASNKKLAFPNLKPVEVPKKRNAR